MKQDRRYTKSGYKKGLRGGGRKKKGGFCCGKKGKRGK